MVCLVKCTFISHSAVVMLSGELVKQADNQLRTTNRGDKALEEEVEGILLICVALLTSVSSTMCGLLLCPGPELRSRGEKVSSLWFIASRFLQSREWAAWRSRSCGVLKSGTRDSERKGGGTKKILYHHNLIEGLDTWFKEGFFLISVSSPKEPPKFKLAGLILHWLQNDRSFQFL